jgi:hypothetical protein
MALGNFMAVFFTEAFMGFDPEAPLKITAFPADGGALLLFRVQF